MRAPDVQSVRCTHHACRCARAAELAAIADRTGEVRFLVEALSIHESEVWCVEPKASKDL